jgi:hypothetical protein
MVNINWTQQEHDVIGHEMYVKYTPFDTLEEIQPSCYSSLYSRARQMTHAIIFMHWTYFICDGFLAEITQPELQPLYAQLAIEIDLQIQMFCINQFSKSHATIRTFIKEFFTILTSTNIVCCLNEVAEKNCNIKLDLRLPVTFRIPPFVHFNCWLKNADRCIISWDESPIFTTTFPVAPICYDRPSVFYN